MVVRPKHASPTASQETTILSPYVFTRTKHQLRGDSLELLYRSALITSSRTISAPDKETSLSAANETALVVAMALSGVRL
jgi:hypothetical protein